jgi:site-specific recombinase XerD
MTTRKITVQSGQTLGRPVPIFKRHDELLDAPLRRGPIDHWSIGQVLARLPSLPVWPSSDHHGDRLQRLNGARMVLEWLHAHPGNGWQERWVAAGCDEGSGWIDRAIVADLRAYSTRRAEVTTGLSLLLLCRVVLPSYTFLASYRPFNLYVHVQQVCRPELFARIRLAAPQIGVDCRQLEVGLRLISKIVLHTGREVDQLSAEDIFAYRAWSIREHRRSRDGIHLSWSLLREVAHLGEHVSLRNALRFGQRPTADLVDHYEIKCTPIRDVLVRYLDERRPALDHGTFLNLISVLVRNFWVDIEEHHPGIDTLHLPEEIAQAWKLRAAVVVKNGEVGRPRQSKLDILMRVRGFYLDIQEWALENPSWAPWAVPSPVRRGDLAGMAKAKQQTTAAMHQRIRERLPHLPALADTADRHRSAQAALLAAATAAGADQVFEHEGRRFRRSMFKSYTTPGHKPPPPTVVIDDLATGDQLDVTREEDEAFWAWALVETLRHTGVRIEELLEITQLALVSYTLTDTREVVPLLQIVPSKGNEERLLLVGPELASVLASIVSRLRRAHNGVIPLVARYDHHERLTGPNLPHLFQRKLGHRHEVISYRTVQKLLTQTLQRADLRDTANNPLHYTPHDFRRMFATESVTGGLPVHIAARLLGHKNLNTTQAYLAVFNEDLIRAYRSFLDQRRAVRPTAEYREPTAAEWREFEQHFQLRKLELGTCGRPYGTPLQARARLHPLPHVACRPPPETAPGRDHPQPRRTDHRGPDERLARRSPGLANQHASRQEQAGQPRPQTPHAPRCAHRPRHPRHQCGIALALTRCHETS